MDVLRSLSPTPVDFMLDRRAPYEPSTRYASHGRMIVYRLCFSS